ncbi:hypothetical protein BYT27DRAFT_7011681, partial [Phlegmacium glaucopus]
QSNWKNWSMEILDLLDMVGLGSYLTDDILSAPPVGIQPNAHRNWMSNDQSVCGFIRSSISATERDLVSSLITAKATWDKLQEYHLEEGPIRQANLIQGALAIQIDHDNTMM